MESDNIIQLNEMDVTEINSVGHNQHQSYESWVRINEQQSTEKVTESSPQDESLPLIRAEPSTDGSRLVTFHCAKNSPTVTIVWWTVGFEPNLTYYKLFQTTVQTDTRGNFLGALAISNCGTYVTFGIVKNKPAGLRNYGAATHTAFDDGSRIVVRIAVDNLQSTIAWFAYDNGGIENLVVSDSDRGLILVYDHSMRNIIHRYEYNHFSNSPFLRRASWRLTEKYYASNAIDRDKFTELHSLHMTELLIPASFRPVDWALSRGKKMVAAFVIHVETKAYHLKIIYLENLMELASVKVGESETISPHLKYFAFTNNDTCIAMTLRIGQFPGMTQIYKWSFYNYESPRLHLQIANQNVEGVFRCQDHWAIIAKQGDNWELNTIPALDDPVVVLEDFEAMEVKEDDVIMNHNGAVMKRWWSSHSEHSMKGNIIYSKYGTRSLEISATDDEHESWQIILRCGSEIIFTLPLGWCTDTKCIFKTNFLDSGNQFFVADKNYFQLWQVDDSKVAVLQYAQILSGGDVNLLYGEEGNEDPEKLISSNLSEEGLVIKHIQLVRQRGAHRLVDNVPLQLTASTALQIAAKTMEAFIHLLQTSTTCPSIAILPLYGILIGGCKARILECINAYPIIRYLGIMHLNMVMDIDKYTTNSEVYTTAHERVFEDGMNFIVELVESYDLFISTSVEHSDFGIPTDISRKLSMLTSPQGKVLMPYFLRAMNTRPAYLRSVTASWKHLCGSPRVATTFIRAAACTPSPFTLDRIGESRHVTTKYISGKEIAALAPSTCLVDSPTVWSWRLLVVNRFFRKFFGHPKLELHAYLPRKKGLLTLCVNPLPHFGSYQNMSRSDYWFRPRSPFTIVVDHLFNEDEIFDLPMMEATIIFKWRTFARTRWLWLRLAPRVLYCAAFFTAAILVSNPSRSYPLVSYILMIIVLGFAGTEVVHELLQIITDRWKYFQSLYNWFDLLMIGFTVASAIPTIRHPHTQQQNWVLPLTVIFAWIHLLLQLRVFRAIGTYVDILWELFKQVFTFLVILAALVLSFAHGLFIYLRGQTASSPATFTGTLSDGTLVDISQVVDSSTNKFMRFDMSLKATYFFLTGDYSSISYWDGDPLVDIVKIFFSFITGIMMLNVLIAILSDVINMAREQGKRRWLRELAKVIVEIERSMLLPWERLDPHWFPEFIFYGADPDTVKEWEKTRREAEGAEIATDEVARLREENMQCAVELRTQLESLELNKQTIEEQREQIKALFKALGGGGAHIAAQEESKPIGTFTVLSTFTPSMPDELEVQLGDKVTVLTEYDDGWVTGINESRGRLRGVLPRTCLDYDTLSGGSKVSTADASGRGAKRNSSRSGGSLHMFTVISTHEAEQADELGVEIGDKVTVLAEYDDGWVLGINESRGSRQKGIFPKNCVDFRQPPGENQGSSSMERLKRGSSITKRYDA
ncbi:hypothetical protein BC937DRAFT_88628 [Endogone sp. FLAS-F59071]|nr:hypothetical protein BC937DRAFT_88628 [Endogone sp. FLAS-F59071]|eukprot:RUS18553.1 hypothetical protein BC937DRAFT_88628 [Endogone sp. FLAS-F59071]